jgi:hypothetical protein
VAADTAKFASVEREPRLEGRNMFMILSPRQDVIATVAAQKAAAAKSASSAPKSTG